MSWSLYKKKSDVSEDNKGNLGENLFSYEGEKLEPLKFSNGKTQQDVVEEVLEAIQEGHKIVLIHGACGSGKSAIALNLAKHFKKTAVVVPIKSLQDQYEQDYTNKNYILRDDKKPLSISVLKGRANFPCLFSGEQGTKASEETLPCHIELRERNMDKILTYIEQNKDVKKEDFATISDVRRVSVAAACPYWSPVLPSSTGGKVLSKAKKRPYMSVSGKEYALFQRAKGCKFYDQYNAYIDSDVMIFNSMKYLLETAIGRKPKTDLDIIDECDEFLDSFANERKINLNRLISALNVLVPKSQEEKNAIKDLIVTANNAIAHYHDGLDKLEDSFFLNLFNKILENPYLAEEEDNNYYNYVFESVKSFEPIVPETYAVYEKQLPRRTQPQTTLFEKKIFADEKDTTFVSLVSVNIARKFKELADMNNVIVMMSGTLHSEEVLKDIFGLEKFKIIQAENKNPGELKRIRTGKEMNCKFSNFTSGAFTRKDYLQAMNYSVANAELPLVVHVSSFGDLPSDEEKENYELDFLASRNELHEMQKNPKIVEEFKEGKRKILFTTKCSRGVDFPGEQCNSIMLTKYPYPNIQGMFWRILKKEQPDKFMEFYLDKANRELVQKIARGLRFEGDKVNLLSPDTRVLDAVF